MNQESRHVLNLFKDGNISLSEIPPQQWEDSSFVIDICNLSQKATNFIFNNYEHLLNDKEIFLGIFVRNKACFSYMSNELRSDVDFWLKILDIDGSVSLNFASENVQLNMDIGLKITSNHNFSLINPLLRDDENFVAKHIINHPYCIQNAGPNILNNQETILKFAKLNSSVSPAFIKMSSQQLLDENFLLELLSIEPDAIFVLQPEFYTKKIIFSLADTISLEEDSFADLYLKQLIREDNLADTLNQADNDKQKVRNKSKKKV